jgi:ABC-type branched-subunit amino acid transport system substrate-binding protein
MRAFCIVFLLAASVAAQTSPLTPGEQHGQHIYLTGENVVATLGGNGAELPASAAACGNCHGHDGSGNPEGGTRPANVSWQELTRSNRDHPYTEALLQRAITGGIDSGGRELQAVMPRFRMTSGDMADLISYLRKVGAIADPGVLPDSVRIGVVFPPGKRSGSASTAIEAALKAHFADLNRGSGIYHRRIELLAARDGESTKDFVARERIFALVASYADPEAGIPVIGSLASDPELESQTSRNVFYLYPGLTGQARALLAYASKTHAATRILFDGEAMRPLAERLAREGTGVTVQSLDQTGAGESDSAAILLLGPAGKLIARPQADIYIPASLAGAETLAGRAFLAYPTFPPAESPEAGRQYRELASRYHLPAGQLAAQWAALASAAILTEGLKRAGNDLTREKLVTAIEGLYEFPTGFTHAVTYGPRRHIGAQGAYVVETSGATQAFHICGWVQEYSKD